VASKLCVTHDSFQWVVMKSPPSIIIVECIFIYMWLRTGTKFQLVQTKNWCPHTSHAKTYCAWHIAWTYVFKPWPCWTWVPILKTYFNLSITIIFTTLNNIFKLASWLNFINAKVIKSWKTSRSIGSRCYHQWKKSWVNTRFWLLIWLKTM
jgi:hypothetical protein